MLTSFIYYSIFCRKNIPRIWKSLVCWQKFGKETVPVLCQVPIDKRRRLS